MNNTDETFLREIDIDNALKSMGFEPMTKEETENNNTIEKFYSLIREWTNSDYFNAKVTIESIKEAAKNNDQTMNEAVLDFCISHNDACLNLDNFLSFFGYAIDDSKVLEKFKEDKKSIAIEKGFSLLMDAAYEGNIDAAKKLLKSGVDIFYQNKDGDTALSLALMQYHSHEGKEEHGEIASEIIKICGGEGINYGDFFDLIYAAKDGNTQLLNKLINAGIFLDFQTDSGYTALMEAIIKEHDDIVMKLLDAGANPDLSIQNNRFTPLGWVASQGNMELVKKIISVNANLNILDSNQQSPLVKAIGRKHLDVGITLIDAGSNPNIFVIDEYGYKKYTALMLASANGYIDVVKKLLNCSNIDINCQNSMGYTALIWAVSNNHDRVAQELILAGADINLATKEGDTVLNMRNK